MRTIPLLPCASIDEIAEFAVPLGFAVTYRQLRPNPYLALERADLAVHYFGIEGFRPEDSYGSCVVVVEDTEPLYDAFAAGLRAAYGRLPMSGFPRITRPRRRKNAGNLSGFSLIDPAGNWIRVFAASPAGPGFTRTPGGRLADAVANAVVSADSHGDVGQALKILRSALRRQVAEAPPTEVLEALGYLAELAARQDDPALAAEVLDELRSVLNRPGRAAETPPDPDPGSG